MTVGICVISRILFQKNSMAAPKATHREWHRLPKSKNQKKEKKPFLASLVCLCSSQTENAGVAHNVHMYCSERSERPSLQISCRSSCFCVFPGCDQSPETMLGLRVCRKRGHRQRTVKRDYENATGGSGERCDTFIFRGVARLWRDIVLSAEIWCDTLAATVCSAIGVPTRM